ncbi:MAG: hypothetical protein KatS3mg117_0125 [Geminicoccaceae bacterium]|nr:MAG: hypothetical protein KatS3mg117_0125 [Geminicoccaceae bacterium]
MNAHAAGVRTHGGVRRPGPAAPTWIQPRYMADFACLADACPNTCCKGWTIEVDPGTAERWRRHADPAHRARLTTALVERRDPGAPVRTVMRLGSNGCCTLLREDGLCSVHAEFGEDWLAESCRNYPRLETGTGSLRHRAGSIGCVEVARRVLGEPDALTEASEGDPLVMLAPVGIDGIPARGPAIGDQEAAWLRSVVLRLFGRHDLPWSARVALFTITIEDLGRIDLVRSRRRLLDLVLRTESVLRRPELAGFDGIFPAEPERVVPTLVPIVRVLLEVGRSDAPIAETARALTVSFESAGDATSLGSLVENLASASRKGLEPELDARPHLRGNLVAAALLHERFPVGRPSTAVDAAWNAALFWALWKLLVCGVVFLSDKPFETAAVEVAYRLGRIFAHWPAAQSALRRDLDRRGVRTSALLAALLR